MLTSSTGRNSEMLWPSLAGPSNASFSSSSATTATGNSKSFFGDKVVTKKSTHVTAPIAEKNADDFDDEDEIECKAPVYKNNLSEALASALKSKATLCEANQAKTTSGKNNKKKGKKTLLFSSGMNFN